MATYTYSISGDFPNQKVNPCKLEDDILESSITKTLEYVNSGVSDPDNCDISFDVALTSGEETTLSSIVSVHDGEPNPTPVEEFLDLTVEVTDPYTNVSGNFLEMQVLMNRREIFNDDENPLYVSTLVPILGSGGHLQDHADRILNLETIHGKTGWLFKPGSVKALQESIKKLMPLTEQIVKAGENARKQIEQNNSSDDYLKKIEKIYNKVLDSQVSMG